MFLQVMVMYKERPECYNECVVPCFESAGLQVSLWVYLSVMQLKARHYTHANVALLALEGCSFPPPPLLVATDGTVLLQLTTN